jgi:gamma-glutamyltranspeptidase/glutathione hydrolase
VPRFALVAAVAVAFAGVLVGQAAAQVVAPAKQSVAVGKGGAAASVDPLGTQAAIDVLKHGGNAVDAAVAAAAMLGVTEPYSCGVGGGGFMVVYRAADKRVFTIDGREMAPAAFRPDIFIDPATGTPLPFAEAVESGLGVGVPGTPRTWQEALARFGTRSLSSLLQPAIRVADQGFVVDQTFFDQTESNRDRFDDFTTTRDVFLTPVSFLSPPVGSVFRNPQLAATYRTIAAQGVGAIYAGPIANGIVETVQHPPLAPAANHNVRPGVMTAGDLAAYVAKWRAPTSIGYRGRTVNGMGPPSSGGSTVGESLNILEGFPLSSQTRTQALHEYLETTALAYADRAKYLGDPDFISIPLRGILSDSFAAERRALIGPTAAAKPVPPGTAEDNEGPSTTHLTVADKWGNVVTYTFTIEQIGGSAMVADGYGFLLNNELTDFDFQPGLPNSPAARKRPRSSMAPTIVLNHKKPDVALGSPGGSTIITTVLQTLVEHLDLGKSLPDAIATPRASQRNTASVSAEPAFIASPDAAALMGLGHTFTNGGEIGALEGIDFLSGGRMQAAVEPVRRGGGHADAIASKGRALHCGWTGLPPRMRAGANRRFALSLRIAGTPAKGRLTARGAGVRIGSRTTERGTALLRLHPRHRGTIVVRTAGGCVKLIRVR